MHISRRVTSRQRRRLGRQFSRVVAVGLVSAVAVAMAPAASVAADPPTFTAQGLTSTGSQTAPKAATSRLAQSDPAVLQATGTAKVPVLVKLDYDSVATYSGGLQNLQPTSPSATNRKLDGSSDAVKQYDSYVAGVEDAFTSQLSAAIPEATVGTRLRTVFGGIALSLPADRAKDLLKLPGVVAVQADQVNHPLTDSSPAFIGAPTLYSALGSDTTAGKGAIVGVLDTGVWPEHPSFNDPGVGPVPPKADGTTQRVCDFGDNPLTPEPDVFQCNDKLISGEPFLKTYNDVVGGEVYPDTARDSDGHGTHTASTSAGAGVDHATVLGVDRGPIHGIAPGAHVAVYKVCGAAGCFSSDSVAAVEQAINDGVNVINFSISGGAQPFSDAVELAFLDAYAAGVFVAASAGNSGPGAGTTDHQGPWVTTVAASTQQRAFQSTLTVTSGTYTYTTTGASITAGVTAATPVVLSSDAPYSNLLCDAPAPAGIFTGKIVACQRGTNPRVDKGFNVLQGGAVGMILYNPTLADVETDNHWLPAVQLADGTDFLAFLQAHPESSATFTAGEKATGQGDVMAAFSSRGPGGNWLKPDVTAPGVEILAGMTPTPDNITVGPPGQYYQAIAGTSMSSPHVAGSAALLVSLHPDWTPGQIKSALETTAKTSVVKEDLTTPADPYDFGGGRIDLTKAGDPGLTFDVSAAQFHAAAADNVRKGVDLNLPSINIPELGGAITTYRVAKNVTTQRMTYHVSATAPAGATITVTPSRFTVSPGQTVKLKIEINAGRLLIGDTHYFGQITLDQVSGSRDLHLPVAFTRGVGSVALTTACAPTTVTLAPRTKSNCKVTATNSAYAPAVVDTASSVNSTLSISSINGAVRTPAGSARLQNAQLSAKVPGVPSIKPATTTLGGYLPLDELGITPDPLADETIRNYSVPDFLYAGDTYSAIGVTSNGYLVVGGGTSADVQYEPQSLPDPVPTNNLLAPFWTDLNGTGAPGAFVATLSDGVDTWLVVEWRVFAYGTSDLKVFQAWIGLNKTEDISYTYDPANLPTQPTGQDLTVGAENINGSGGAEIQGAPTGDLSVTTSGAKPGGTASYQFTVRGLHSGTGHILTTLTSPAVPGKTLVWNAIRVNQQ